MEAVCLEMLRNETTYVAVRGSNRLRVDVLVRFAIGRGVPKH